MGVGFVIRQVKMVIFKGEQVIHLGGQNHPRRRQRRPANLQTGLLQMIQVEMCVA